MFSLTYNSYIANGSIQARRHNRNTNWTTVNLPSCSWKSQSQATVLPPWRGEWPNRLGGRRESNIVSEHDARAPSINGLQQHMHAHAVFLIRIHRHCMYNPRFPFPTFLFRLIHHAQQKPGCLTRNGEKLYSSQAETSTPMNSWSSPPLISYATSCTWARYLDCNKYFFRKKKPRSFG